METLRSLGEQMEALLEQVDRAVEEYSEASGLRCPEGCGACCHSPDIEVTLLDALPMALEMVAEGRGEEVAEWSGKQCPMFEDHGMGFGRCVRYGKRPSLCRLFGYAGVRRKDGLVQLAMCRVHKQLGVAVDEEVRPPLYETFSRQLIGIHPGYGTERLPIQEAVRQAVEKVLLARQFET